MTETKVQETITKPRAVAHRIGILTGAVAMLSGLGGCASTGAGHGAVFQRGEAAYYADSFAGRRTASGERFNPHAMTAAHRRLPLGSRVRVTNLTNRRQVVVRINDRGPFTRGRVIDLSPAAARQLQMIRAGVAPVTLQVISKP